MSDAYDCQSILALLEDHLIKDVSNIVISYLDLHAKVFRDRERSSEYVLEAPCAKRCKRPKTVTFSGRENGETLFTKVPCLPRWVAPSLISFSSDENHVNIFPQPDTTNEYGIYIGGRPVNPDHGKTPESRFRHYCAKPATLDNDLTLAISRAVGIAYPESQ